MIYTRLLLLLSVLFNQHKIFSGDHCTSGPGRPLQEEPLGVAGARMIYRPDALPVTRPTVSKHWRSTREHVTEMNSSMHVARLWQSQWVSEWVRPCVERRWCSRHSADDVRSCEASLETQVLQHPQSDCRHILMHAHTHTHTSVCSDFNALTYLNQYWQNTKLHNIDLSQVRSSQLPSRCYCDNDNCAMHSCTQMHSFF